MQENKKNILTNTPAECEQSIINRNSENFQKYKNNQIRNEFGNNSYFKNNQERNRNLRISDQNKDTSKNNFYTLGKNENSEGMKNQFPINNRFQDNLYYNVNSSSVPFSGNTIDRRHPKSTNKKSVKNCMENSLEYSINEKKSYDNSSFDQNPNFNFRYHQNIDQRNNCLKNIPRNSKFIGNLIYNENNYRYSKNNDVEKYQHNSMYSKNNYVNIDGRLRENDIKYQTNAKHNSAIRKDAVIKKKNEVDISKLDQREYLIHELNLNRYECMICMNIVHKNNSIWSCDNCFHIFHLQCISKWANSVDDKEELLQWRCPTCQNKNENIKNDKLIYTCFCKKEVNPVFKHGNIAHSCGDVCCQKNQTNNRCPHLCSLQCHPGPCPPCESSITRKCHCQNTQITARCTADESQFQCQSLCGKSLNCGLHKCEKQCHINDGHICNIIIKQVCCCGRNVREVLCGSKESKETKYTCTEICNRKKNCGNHNCLSPCHDGKCNDCILVPNKIKNCWCGKVSLNKLQVKRKTCLDPIPSCKNNCNKRFEKCGHICKDECHDGECKPCPDQMETKCRCEGAMVTVKCSSMDVPLCQKKCQKKLLCSRHRCENQCCDINMHLCSLKCGKMLSCKSHKCERECGHMGQCPTCLNVSFDELFCECGTTFALPPIACGQKPPFCKELCSKEHLCDHEVRHNCHKESKCPPCTELVSKPCPGGHTEYFNIPCFRPVVTCGRVCGKSLSNCPHSCLKNCHLGECVETDQFCKQPCSKVRTDCGHPCGIPCHNGDCDTFMNCTFVSKLYCNCGLRFASFTCLEIESFKKNESLLSKYDLYHCEGNINFVLTCNMTCSKALIASNHFQKAYILDNGNSKVKFQIDQTLSCFQKCVSTCHYALSLSNALEKSCTSSSYLCVQRYYGPYLEEFARFNINFVMSLEKIFTSFFTILSKDNAGKCSHQFYSITAEKCQFIKRFSSTFRLICLVSDNKDGTKNVIVKAEFGNYCAPKMLLSKKVEEKYFKMPKIGC